MKLKTLLQWMMVTWATVGLCLPELAFSATPAPTPAVVDIELADGGVLHGQVVDLQKGGVAGVPVSLLAQDREVARTATTENGQFTIPGLRGGVYRVAAGKEAQGLFRIWSARTAPPAAQKKAIVYTQNCCAGGGGTLKMLLSNPIIVAGLVATAIAVPVALACGEPASP